MYLDKAAFAMNLLEIGKRKYTDLRRICKPEDILFISYNIIGDYRKESHLSKRLESLIVI